MSIDFQLFSPFLDLPKIFIVDRDFPSPFPALFGRLQELLFRAVANGQNHQLQRGGFFRMGVSSVAGDFRNRKADVFNTKSEGIPGICYFLQFWERFDFL
jgi:hypothetical protein